MLRNKNSFLLLNYSIGLRKFLVTLFVPVYYYSHYVKLILVVLPEIIPFFKISVKFSAFKHHRLVIYKLKDFLNFSKLFVWAGMNTRGDTSETSPFSVLRFNIKRLREASEKEGTRTEWLTKAAFAKELPISLPADDLTF